MAYFGREQLAEFALPDDDSYDVKSFPIILFIDDFGVHRNMYRALKAFYCIPAALPYDERRKIANVFTLTLGPPGADVQDIVTCLRKALKELGHGVFLTLNGRKTLVRAYVVVMIGDLPQQANNAGFLGHSALHGCRSCFSGRRMGESGISFPRTWSLSLGYCPRSTARPQTPRRRERSILCQTWNATRRVSICRLMPIAGSDPKPSARRTTL